MNRHVSHYLDNMSAGGRGPVWLILASLVAAAAVLASPLMATDMAGIAAILLIGAISLLAGHVWGVVVVGSASLLLAGRLVPLLGGSSQGLQAIVAIVACVPAIIVCLATLPHLARSPFQRRWLRLGARLAIAVVFVTPVL
jgi:hypothetical protein